MYEQIITVFQNAGFVAIRAKSRVAIALHTRKINKMEVQTVIDQNDLTDKVVVDRDVYDNVCVYVK